MYASLIPPRPSGRKVSILRGLKERYEVHHGVRLQDAALVSAAQLSHRYIADRFLPDKAIDLVDEAAAKLNIEASRCVCIIINFSEPRVCPGQLFFVHGRC